MDLRTIDYRIAGLIDPETGEVADWQEFKKLSMERETAIEELALLILQKQADRETADAEIKRMKATRESLDRQIDRLKLLLDDALGEDAAFSSGRVRVATRRTVATEIYDEDAVFQWLDTHHNAWKGNYEPPYKETRTLSKRGLGTIMIDHDVPGVRQKLSRSVTVK